MARYSSDSDSDSGRKRSSKKGKKKTKSRKRSRSSSSDRQRSRDSRRRSRSRSRDSRRHSKSRSRDSRRRSRSRSRSRSDDSYYSRRKRSTSRSRGRRSRSRSSSRERYSKRRRSRSRSREKSRKRGGRSRNRSDSRERSVPKKKSQPPKQTVVKQKDPCEDIPGFAEMTPVQQNRLRMQAAFKALDTEKVAETTAVPAPAAAETALEHMERAQVIADIQDEGFMPTHFSSTRSTKTAEPPKTSWPTNLVDQEDYHEMAIFGNSGALALDEKSKKQISDAAGAIAPKKTSWKDRDPKSLAHPNLHISKEEADRRWFEFLAEMRKQALQAAS